MIEKLANQTQDSVESQKNRADDGAVRGRRAVLKGAVAAMPMILTLQSGAALARSSNMISASSPDSAIDAEGRTLAWITGLSIRPTVTAKPSTSIPTGMSASRRLCPEDTFVKRTRGAMKCRQTNYANAAVSVITEIVPGHGGKRIMCRRACSFRPLHSVPSPTPTSPNSERGQSAAN